MSRAFLAVAVAGISIPLFGQPPFPEVRIGAALQAPNTIQLAGNPPSGFFVDVLTEAARRAGYKAAWVFRDKALEDVVASNDVDIYAGAFATPERRRKLHFTAPWWKEDYYVLVRESMPIRGLADLSGRRVMYERHPPTPVPMNLLLPGTILIERRSREERIAAVCDGHVDAAVIGHIGLEMARRQWPEPCKGVSLRVIPQNAFTMDLSIVSKHEDAAVADAIRAKVGEMLLDGSVQQAALRYGIQPFLSDEFAIYRPPLNPWAAAVAGIALLAAAAVLIRRTRRRVRNAEERAANAEAIAQQASRAREEFLGMMSHEIRTPMNAVLGFMELLQQTHLQPDQRELASDIGRATSSLLSLLTDIMEYSKFRSGAVALHSAPASLAELVDDVAATVALSAESKHLEFVVHIDTKTPDRYIGDTDRLRQIAVNLLSNAVKFTRAGYVRLDVDYDKDRGLFRFLVSDSGSGIPREAQQRIFEPFYQRDMRTIRETGGIGLGLAITRELSNAMGGKITLESREGFGSKFRVELPLLIETGARPWIESLPSGNGRRVLLIAQSSENINVLLEALRNCGCDVSVFDSPQSAKRWVERRNISFDVLIIEASAAAASTDILAVIKDGSNGHCATYLTGTLTATRVVSQMGVTGFNGALSWPITPQVIRRVLVTKEREQPLIKAPGPNSAPVLIVDDNPVNRKVASALLSRLGCLTEFAEDGNIAVEKCRSGSFSLVLMDCQMPVMDGYEAAHRIREMPGRGERLPIYGVSASVDEATSRRCLEAGMDGYLPKPITLEALGNLLQQLPSASGAPY